MSSNTVLDIELTTVNGTSTASSNIKNDKHGQKKFTHPEDTSSIVGKLLVRWILPLIQLANEKKLTEKDVWPTPETSSVESSCKIVQDSWEHEKKMALLEKRQPSYSKAIFKGFFDRIVSGGLFQLSFLLMQLAQPLLVGKIVRYVKSGDEEFAVGISYAIVLGIVSLISSMAVTSALFTMRRVAVLVRNGVMMHVFKHALLLTSASKSKNSVGQTTNLVAIDSEKLFLSFQFLHFLWHGIVASIAVMLMLIRDVGVFPACIGLIWIACLIPLQNKIARNVGIVRRSMITFTDERIKCVNEILQNIRTIKLMAWEKPMEEKVLRSRSAEVEKLGLYLLFGSMLRELMFSVGPITSMLIFTTYVYGSNKPLDIVLVFKVLAYINTLRFPLNLLGQALKNYNDSKISVQRLTTFFMLPTVVATDSEAQAARAEVVFTHASLSWIHMDKCDASFAADTRGTATSNASSSTDAYMSTDTNASNTETCSTNSCITSNSGSSSTANCVCDDKGITSALPAAVAPAAALGSQFMLTDISFKTTSHNELVAVVGSVGSGKSSFISSMISELVTVAGSINISGSIAYCAQCPWIQNLSLRNNILFGLDYEDPLIREQYERVLDAAALRPDIAVLPDGDSTEIGERGITLSGGQKARVAIARALLSSIRTNIILMDDPWSAVDGNTGNYIFEHGIVRYLHDKMRIIALNSHMHLLSRFHRIVVMEQGRVIADGTYQHLLHSHLDLLVYSTGMSSDELHRIGTCNYNNECSSSSNSQAVYNCSKSPAVAMASTRPTSSVVVAKKLMVTEKRAVGVVPWKVYSKYFSFAFKKFNAATPWYEGGTAGDKFNDETNLYIAGTLYAVGLVIVFAMSQVARVAVDYTLAAWSVEGGSHQSTWAGAFYISQACLMGSLWMRSSYLNRCALKCCAIIQQHVLRVILSAPITTFYDTHTVGEILNRFAKDSEVIDSSIPEFMLQVLINWFQIVSVFVLCIWTSPWFVLIMVPLIVLFLRIFNYFSSVSSDLKKLESVSRSPIYASLSETLSGLDTIRAFGDTKRFLRNHTSRCEYNMKFFFHLWLCQSWITARLEIITCIVLFVISILAISLRTTVSPISLGLALSYGLQLTALFQRSCQVSIDLSNYMTSTERVIEYLNIPSESSCVHGSNSGSLIASLPSAAAAAAWSRAGSDLQSWPANGSIELKDIWMRYRDNEYVVKGISLSINSGERIGICGRTGSGKSSILLCLFRIVELSKGSITIDGHDISQVPLQVLRQRIAIIPQDPVVFSGTIRFQLDPSGIYNDEAIYAILEQINMKAFVSSLPKKLNHILHEKGDNLSQGERQLLCIARAQLRQCKIIVIDEGTSAVDPNTDAIVQAMLKEHTVRNKATVITIAHRLSTILDYDKVLVLDDGRVIEYGEPSALLGRTDSAFKKMMNKKMMNESVDNRL